jgi:preprotein translocase subunit SecA
MDTLREAVHLRAWGGLDPLVQYQKEGYDYFQQLLDHIAEDVTRVLLAYSPEGKDDADAASAPET